MDYNDYNQSSSNQPVMGKLKIFFGYAAGVGKTYAMLEAAQELKKENVDVVVGYIEKHTRPETLALLNGLEQLPTKTVQYRGIELQEFDIDGALRRNPDLILVDELAHSNAPGSRHSKRYQDVQELLKAGIDVYTTINVQHLESLNDVVASITNIAVSERIPDSVFDSADQVELVDIEPIELIERLEAGKIYKKQQAQRALNHFFTKDNLAALREISLRRTADQLSRSALSSKQETKPKAKEHILVCMTNSRSDKKVIRTAARLAEAFYADFTAIYVQDPQIANASEEEVIPLDENIRLAEQLNARVVTLYGDEPALQISEYAKLSGITKMIVGRAEEKKQGIFKKPLADKLSGLSGDIEVYIIPENSELDERKHRFSIPLDTLNWIDFFKMLLLLTTATLISALFHRVHLGEANIITVYILAVLFTAMWTEGYIYGVLSSLIGVLAFNFFFTIPKYTFNAYDSDYPVTFLVMLVASVVTSSLATRVENQAVKSAEKAHSIEVLMGTNQKLQGTENAKEAIKVTASQLYDLLNRPIIYCLSEDASHLEFKVFPESINFSMNKEEIGVASWVLKNDKSAGATTNTLSNAHNLYLPIRGKQSVMGVIGIYIKEYPPIESFEKNLVISILDECGTILERQKLKEEKQAIELKTQRETLRANLLRAISHDLRTPLTSISGNASMLMNPSLNLTDEKKATMYNSIYDDSEWLINLTENLLAITKIDNGIIQLNKNAEIIDDVFQEALSHADRHIKDYQVKVNIEEDFLIAQMDVRLIVQVIINILNNAIKYTPKGSTIELRAFRDEDMLRVEISDDGPGISDESKAHIFDMFYTNDHQQYDNRRGLGLGLHLCKTIVETHGGKISVRDNQPHGAIFSFTLPLEEVNTHV